MRSDGFCLLSSVWIWSILVAFMVQPEITVFGGTSAGKNKIIEILPEMLNVQLHVAAKFKIKILSHRFCKNKNCSREFKG